MSGTRVSYHDEQQPPEGYLAAHASGRNLPSVLVMPSRLNINESICRRADRLAELMPANYKHASLTLRRACSDSFLMELHGTWHRHSPR
jgi:hypothetical protein